MSVSESVLSDELLTVLWRGVRCCYGMVKWRPLFELSLVLEIFVEIIEELSDFTMFCRLILFRRFVDWWVTYSAVIG